MATRPLENAPARRVRDDYAMLEASRQITKGIARISRQPPKMEPSRGTKLRRPMTGLRRSRTQMVIEPMSDGYPRFDASPHAAMTKGDAFVAKIVAQGRYRS